MADGVEFEKGGGVKRLLEQEPPARLHKPVTQAVDEPRKAGGERHQGARRCQHVQRCRGRHRRGAGQAGVPGRALSYGRCQTGWRRHDFFGAGDTRVEGVNACLDPIPERRAAKPDRAASAFQRPTGQTVVPKTTDAPADRSQPFVDEIDTLLSKVQVGPDGVLTGGPGREARVFMWPCNVLARVQTAQEL